MKMKKIRRYAIPVILLLLIWSAIVFLMNNNKTPNVITGETWSDIVFSQQVQFNNNLDSFATIDDPKIQSAMDSMEVWDVKSAISDLESLLESWQFSGDQLSSLHAFLITNYLTFGSAYYDESNNAIKARWLLENGTISNETWFYNYHMGYSYEIENNFEQALAFYNQALLYWNNIAQAQTLNQIGHVYDLQWNLDEAYRYYTRAYSADWENIQVNTNLGRVYTRNWDLEKAKKYFEYVADNTDNKVFKSEVYFNLSTLAFYSSWSLDDSLDFAKKSISENPDYPLAYIWLARGLIQKWEASLDVKESLDKAIQLYPDLATAHKYLWIYYYINEDFDNAIASFNKYAESAKTDITLMENQRLEHYVHAQYDLARSYALKWDVDNAVDILEKIMSGDMKFAFFPQFMEDVSSENSVFGKIVDEDRFQNFFTQLVDNFNT